MVSTFQRSAAKQKYNKTNEGKNAGLMTSEQWQIIPAVSAWDTEFKSLARLTHSDVITLKLTNTFYLPQCPNELLD